MRWAFYMFLCLVLLIPTVAAAGEGGGQARIPRAAAGQTTHKGNRHVRPTPQRSHAVRIPLRTNPRIKATKTTNRRRAKATRPRLKTGHRSVTHFLAVTKDRPSVLRSLGLLLSSSPASHKQTTSSKRNDPRRRSLARRAPAKGRVKFASALFLSQQRQWQEQSTLRLLAAYLDPQGKQQRLLEIQAMADSL